MRIHNLNHWLSITLVMLQHLINLIMLAVVFFTRRKVSIKVPVILLLVIHIIITSSQIFVFFIQVEQSLYWATYLLQLFVTNFCLYI